MKNEDPNAWQVSVQGLRVRIDYHGIHYRTSAPFWPQTDREGVRRVNPNAEALATYFRFAARFYGHPDANDDTPDPPFRPQPEPVLSAKEQRLLERRRHPEP